MWTRPGTTIDESELKYSVVIPYDSWFTLNNKNESIADEGVKVVLIMGHDRGGEIHLKDTIMNEVTNNEIITAFKLTRMTSRALFKPKLLAKGTELEWSSYLASGVISLGKHYDIVALFPDAEQAMVFKMALGSEQSLGYRD